MATLHHVSSVGVLSLVSVRRRQSCFSFSGLWLLPTQPHLNFWVWPYWWEQFLDVLLFTMEMMEVCWSPLHSCRTKILKWMMVWVSPSRTITVAKSFCSRVSFSTPVVTATVTKPGASFSRCTFLILLLCFAMAHLCVWVLAVIGVIGVVAGSTGDAEDNPMLLH